VLHWSSNVLPKIEFCDDVVIKYISSKVGDYLKILWTDLKELFRNEQQSFIKLKSILFFIIYVTSTFDNLLFCLFATLNKIWNPLFLFKREMLFEWHWRRKWYEIKSIKDCFYLNSNDNICFLKRNDSTHFYYTLICKGSKINVWLIFFEITIQQKYILK